MFEGAVQAAMKHKEEGGDFMTQVLELLDSSVL